MSINGEPVDDIFDWINSERPKNEDEDRIRFEGLPDEVRCAREKIRVGVCPALVTGQIQGVMSILCLCDGVATVVDVSSGSSTGLSAELTAYPLILCTENRVAAGKALAADPGTYLLVVRRESFEDQRYPVVVPQEGTAEARVKLLSAGTTPPGFVYVPPGPFVFGGDPEAFQVGPRQVIVLPEFFIARKEVINREWFVFLNDPRIRRRFDLTKGNATQLVPRMGHRNFVKMEGGLLVPTIGHMGTPVSGISWDDVEVYLKWRNQKAEEAGEKWRYDLPAEQEWEKAARGVDSRVFPWGNRFDFSLTVAKYRKLRGLIALPAGFERRDESPYGILDLGGSRCEWCGNAFAPGLNEYTLRGGTWGARLKLIFRSASRNFSPKSHAITDFGFRLVARPRP